jgi:hypothetical protein
METVYLLQPAELVGTDRYKVGRTCTKNLSRCTKSYKLGSRYLCIMECNDCVLLENKIKEKFNKLFSIVAGREYFQGDENIMIVEFIKSVLEFNKINYDYADMINSNNNNVTNDTLKNDDVFETEQKILQCIYCKKVYSRIDNLNRHINKFCKTNNKLNDYDMLKENYKKITDKYDKVIEKIKLFDDDNNSKLFDNTIHTNINKNKIFEYGKEDYSKIPTDILLKTILNSNEENMIINLIEKLHFNKDYPEYQNVCITDRNRKYALFWNGKKWLKHKYEEIGIDMLDRCLYLISDRMDEIEKIVVDKRIFDIKKKVLDKLENIGIEDEVDSSDEDVNAIKSKAIEIHKFRKKASDKIEEFMYNNRDIVKTKY